MGMYLDLDDVAAGNPKAVEELAALRAANSAMREILQTSAGNIRSMKVGCTTYDIWLEEVEKALALAKETS